MSGLVLDGFGGPGGWDEALRMLGIPGFGIELDAAACRTRRAAGHQTVRANMSTFPVERLAGKIWGQCHSAPCTTFSAAGSRAGTAVLHILEAGIRDMFAGRDTRAQRRGEIGRALLATDWIPALPVKRGRAARIATAARTSALVIEPARFIKAGMPEWVALEQVPEVLPLWKVYAEELRGLGYHVWHGKLNAADYGVPQTRIRAILIASRVRTVRRPTPTHYNPAKGMQLWGTPWVSMADALGWGATGRPGPAVTAGGTATGGAEPFPTRARNLLETERDAGQWMVRTTFGEPKQHSPEFDPFTRPSRAVVSKTGDWILHTNRDQRPDGTRQTADPRSAPAPALTAKSGGQWVLKAGNQPHAAQRPAPAPAPTIAFGHNAARMTWLESEFAQDSVRITVREAAILQSFRPDYPWQGTKTQQFKDVGNAVPPRLAMAVVGEATGIAWQALAARFYGESEVAA